MMNRILILCIILMIICVSVSGITLVMKDIVALEPGLSLDDLFIADDTAAGASASLFALMKTIPLALDPDRIHLVPSRYIHKLVSGISSQQAIIIGKNIALVPLIHTEKWGKNFSGQFISFLSGNFLIKDSRVEIEITDDSFSEAGFSDAYLSGPAVQNVMFRIKSKREFMNIPVGKAEILVRSADSGEQENIISLSVHQFVLQVKAKTFLPQNVILSPDRVMVSEGELTPFSGEVLMADDDLFGRISAYRTKKDIEKDSAICKNDIVKILDVKNGEKVTLIIIKGSIRLSMTGKALASGGIGDEINVMPALSNDSVTGRITGPKEVVVEM